MLPKALSSVVPDCSRLYFSESPLAPDSRLGEFLFLLEISSSRPSIDQNLSLAPNPRPALRTIRVGICSSYDSPGRQHRIRRVDMGSVFRCLFYALHFLLASLLVEGTDDDWLSKDDVFR